VQCSSVHVVFPTIGYVRCRRPCPFECLSLGYVFEMGVFLVMTRDFCLRRCRRPIFARDVLSLCAVFQNLRLLTKKIWQTSASGGDERLIYGVSSMQGWRISMEDAHAAILDLQTDDGKETKSSSADTRLSFFGVYDGHGGDRVALFAGDNIHQIIAKQEAFKKGDIEQALKDGFLATDRAILNGLRA
jgi:hypothetical protein